jgi:hypothetical protein
MLPVTVAHHVKIHTIFFLIVINIQIIGKYLYNNIVLSMLYAEICPNVRRHAGLYINIFFNLFLRTTN